jgi:DNA-binding MarR family transcriptional regulator
MHAHLELEHFLPYRLSVLSNRISQEIAGLYAERFALNVTEWRLLAVLGRYPDLTATELVERTAMDKVAVSRAVASLVADGRLTRKVDGADRRRTKLRLSAKGYRIYDEVAPLALAYQQRLVAALDPGERAQLESLLARLNVSNAG